MDAEQVARATAQEQGLPDTITDVWALAQIAHLVVNAETAGANPDRSDRGPGLGLTTDSSGDPGPEVGRAA